MLDTVKALAQKLEVTEEQAEAYLKLEGKRLLELAEDNLELARDHLKSVVHSVAQEVADRTAT